MKTFRELIDYLKERGELETVGKEVRKLYSWSDEDKLINN